MKYEYLFFDADNTLWDFNLSQKYALFKVITDKGLEYEARFEQIYNEINKACWDQYERNEITSIDLRAIRFERFFKALSVEVDPQETGKAYLDYLGSTDFMIPGAFQLLSTLQKKRKLALVTNGIKEVQRRRIENTRIAPFFETIVISDEIGVAKPHKGFFDHLFNEMGHPKKESSLIIGDSLSSDIKGGNDFEISTCWYNPNGIENNSGIRPTYQTKQLDQLLDIV